MADKAPRRRTRRGHHGSWANRRSLMVLTMFGVAGAAPRDGYSAQVATVQYPRASLYEGLPVDFFDSVDELMQNRLAPNSMAKVEIAFNRYWKPVAEEYGWDVIIATDDPERGGKLAAFVLRMLGDTALVADSISTYVWALRWKMKLSHQADPALGVMHWQEFMRGVSVKAHVPHEPRRAVPLRLILAIIASIDVTVFWEVQFAFLLVVMLFTFSRSECPCPKAFTGPNAWDPNKHWTVRDIVIRCVSGVYVLAVRFKSIKQDRRIERPEARGDHRLDVPQGEAAKGGSDWSFVGDLPGHALSPFKWYRLLMSFYPGPRLHTSPFFLAMDFTRPYTYSAAMKDFKNLLRRVSPTDADYGLHGLRVEGWNLGAAVDPELASLKTWWAYRRCLHPTSTASVQMLTRWRRRPSTWRTKKTPTKSFFREPRRPAGRTTKTSTPGLQDKTLPGRPGGRLWEPGGATTRSLPGCSLLDRWLLCRRSPTDLTRTWGRRYAWWLIRHPRARLLDFRR